MSERAQVEGLMTEQGKAQGKALVLRTCKPDMSSARNGFRWPTEGPVEAPDWDPRPRCGGGLHGLLWGEGDGRLLNWSDDARWLVVEVDEADPIDLDGKVKFPRGVVVHCGDRLSATAYLAERAPGRAITGGTATAGYAGTATAGDDGTATAGDRGTATAGDDGTATAGYAGTATAGYAGTATAGDAGTATAGDDGSATAGYAGTATAGDDGTATAGDRGTATAGYAGTATAGDRGTVMIAYWHLAGARARRRWVVGHVGEGGIEPNVPYTVRDGALVRKEEAE